MKKYFIVSDVHSFFNEMKKALKSAGYDKNNPNHIFVSLGDLFDRGKQSKKCLDFVNSIPDSRKILIKGNHEDLLEEAMNRGYFRDYDYSNKTVDTCLELTSLKLSNGQDKILCEINQNAALAKYLSSCIDYYEINSFIFVHGWIPTNVSDTYDENWRTGDWKSARWSNGFDMWNKGIIEKNKTIICGHWNTSYAHSKYHNLGFESYYKALIDNNNSSKSTKELMKMVHNEPFIDKGIIGIDACTVLSKQVNCIVIEEENKFEGVI